MAVPAVQARLIQEAARRGAALVKATRDATGSSDVATLVAQSMADLRAFAAVADVEMDAVSSHTFALLAEMTGDT